jgi:hypothetical protein
MARYALDELRQSQIKVGIYYGFGTTTSCCSAVIAKQQAA